MSGEAGGPRLGELLGWQPLLDVIPDFLGPFPSSPCWLAPCWDRWPLQPGPGVCRDSRSLFSLQDSPRPCV